MFVIEKDVPIPPYATEPKRGSKPKYLFESMEVGDSFYVPNVARVPPSTLLSARKRTGLRFEQLDGRVWRVS